jgi:ABC-2 type transport system ATP-binding protein
LSEIPRAAVLSATGLSRRFGHRTVVDDVSLEVKSAEIVALLGPNGAGKTTTLRMLAGLIAPTAGTIAIGGIRLSRSTGASLRRRIGFLTEAPGLWDRLTVRENLSIYADLYGVSAAGLAIDRLLLALELSGDADRRAVELSKGTRQKVALARALLHDPLLLLLDEPTSGLDPEVTRTVRRLLLERRGAGCAILVSTHNLDEAERLADRVALLQGRLIAIDTPNVLRQRMSSGRVLVRLHGAADRYLAIAQQFDAGAQHDGPLLTVRISDDRTPALVSALAGAGAAILEVRAEMPPLEDVYLHLLSSGAITGRA